MNISNRKKSILQSSEQSAKERLNWKNKNRYFHNEDIAYLSYLIPKNMSVLDLGCGVGDVLASLNPSRALGIDISQSMILEAKKLYPDYEFIAGDIEDQETLKNINETFDFILMSDTIGFLEDCQSTLEALHRLCKRETRIIITYHSVYWQPILKLAELLQRKMPQPEVNFLSTNDIFNLMSLSGFENVKQEWRQLLPIRFFGLGSLLNKYIATMPLIRKLCLRNYTIGRSMQKICDGLESCSIVIPCRNESGNIESAINRIPDFCKDMEIIFIEGHSSDNTYEEIKRVQKKYREKNIIAMQQDGKGKADAVYKAFDHAKGDVLMILDADLTMPPEQLDKFWDAITSGKGEYINGSRLVYPMDKDAMRYLNLIANQIFAKIFSWLLNQRYTDTLCGTKVLRRTDYIKIRDNQDYFGDFDPFGDFDLIFGSSKLNLKMVEIPITYKARSYGDTQISRFRHGFQLLRMVLHGYRKLKAF